MVQVDPDAIKFQLPEMETYIAKNPGPNPDRSYILAGYATHNESAYLQARPPHPSPPRIISRVSRFRTPTTHLSTQSRSPSLRPNPQTPTSHPET